MIVLPRQARDRYSENSQKRAPSIYAGNPKVKEVTERAIKQIIDAVRKKHFFARLVLPFWFFVPSLSWQSACFMVVFVASLSWQTIVLMHTKQKPKTHTHQQSTVAYRFCCVGLCFSAGSHLRNLPSQHGGGPAPPRNGRCASFFFSVVFALPFPFPSLPFPSLWLWLRLRPRAVAVGLVVLQHHNNHKD